MPGEERGDRETMQSGERNKQHKEDRDLFMKSVRGKEEEKRWGKELLELLKACLPLCTGTPGPRHPARTMQRKQWKMLESPGNRGPAQLPGRLSRLIRLLRTPEMSL